MVFFSQIQLSNVVLSQKTELESQTERQTDKQSNIIRERDRETGRELKQRREKKVFDILASAKNENIRLSVKSNKY